MKKTILFVAIIACFIACSQNNGEDNTAMVKKFYSYYIVEMSNLQPHTKFNRDTLKKYCTIGFLNKIDNDSERDAEPILEVQDFDRDWLKTLTVTKMNSDNEKYFVCFLDNNEKKQHCVLVSLKKENTMKIDNVERFTRW